MRVRSARPLELVAAAALATALLMATGCGTRQQDGGGDSRERDHRARQVAAAWNGSAAAAAWRSGYHPLGEVTQLPQGGLRGKADKQAFRTRSFVLRGQLPGTGRKDGRVAWRGGGSLTRPLLAAKEAYKTLTPHRTEPHLTVTGARLGEMSVPTSRGPAVVPAWLFNLEGYDSPLKQPAVTPSKLPKSPIERTTDAPGHPVEQLLAISPDGRSVTVAAQHGACDKGVVVDVWETRGSVVLSGSVKPDKDRKPGDLCTKEAIIERVTVKLERAVGSRPLLDAITGRPILYKPPIGLARSRN